MTETQRVLSETPRRVAADLLSDLLGSMHLAGVVLFRAEFREPWCVITPGSGQLARVLPFRTEHIIPFHVIAEGGCWLKLKDRERVWLEAGDAVLLPPSTIRWWVRPCNACTARRGRIGAWID